MPHERDIHPTFATRAPQLVLHFLLALSRGLESLIRRRIVDPIAADFLEGAKRGCLGIAWKEVHAVVPLTTEQLCQRAHCGANLTDGNAKYFRNFSMRAFLDVWPRPCS